MEHAHRKPPRPQTSDNTAGEAPSGPPGDDLPRDRVPFEGRDVPAAELYERRPAPDEDPEHYEPAPCCRCCDQPANVTIYGHGNFCAPCAKLLGHLAPTVVEPPCPRCGAESRPYGIPELLPVPWRRCLGAECGHTFPLYVEEAEGGDAKEASEAPLAGGEGGPAAGEGERDGARAPGPDQRGGLAREQRAREAGPGERRLPRLQPQTVERRDRALEGESASAPLAAVDGRNPAGAAFSRHLPHGWHLRELALLVAVQAKAWATEEADLRVRRRGHDYGWHVARSLNELRGFLLEYVAYSSAQLDELALELRDEADARGAAVQSLRQEVAELRRQLAQVVRAGV